MLELIKAGGPVMVPILLLAVLAMAIIIERFWSLRSKEVLPPGLGAEVRDWARGRQLDPWRPDRHDFRGADDVARPCRLSPGAASGVASSGSPENGRHTVGAGR